eukprot:scaffold7064_cov111-Cylindrotheca_fusiformis.AAC.7
MEAAPLDESQEHNVPAIPQEVSMAVPVGCIVVLLVIVSAALAAGLYTSDETTKNSRIKASDTAPSSAPSVAPTGAKTQLLANLLRDSVPYTARWDYPTTPQFRALDWLASEDEWTAGRMEDLGVPIQVLVDRHALIVLTMVWQTSMGSSGLRPTLFDSISWRDPFGMLDGNRSSCDWNNELRCPKSVGVPSPSTITEAGGIIHKSAYNDNC